MVPHFLSRALVASAVLALMWAPSSAEAQVLRRGAQVIRQAVPVQVSPCPGGVCPQVQSFETWTYYSAPVAPAVFPPKETSAQVAASMKWFEILRGPVGYQISPQEEAIIRSWAKRAVRIINQNSCGSGNFCGRDAQGIYILTNAHVASTRIGNVVQVEALLADGSGTEKFQAVVIEAAYSSRTSTDWALLRADASRLKGIDPIKLSKEVPSEDGLTGTWGCPRCEVPQGQLIKTKQLGSLWYWQPNSIGGQSGSAIVQEGVQKGLLTWTISGDGAGQLTSIIYSQSKQQNTDGPARVDNMQPVGGNYAGVELSEGYFSQSSKPIGDYPIWQEGPNPEPIPDPADPCPDLDDDEKRLFGRLRALRQTGSWDWAKIISLILQLLEEIQKGRG